MTDAERLGNVGRLGDSEFNYQDYTVGRFIHYYQQVHHILRLKPAKVLEIGPGDHTITDILRRKGVSVKTFDNAPELHPDYSGDFREKLGISESFDLVIASEVFEHVNVKYLDQILRNIEEVLSEDGRVVVSLPYSTLRLFPKRADYGRFVSCEGVLRTHLPMYFFQPLITMVRGLKRMLVDRKGLTSAFEFHKIPEYPDDVFNVHHWDLGYYPTTRRRVRTILERTFVVVEEKAYVNTNCVFFILKKKGRS